MGTITKKEVVQVCDITKKPVKKSDAVFPYKIGDKEYAEVAGSTITKIEKFVAGLDISVEKAPRAKKEKAESGSGVADPLA